MLGQNEGNVGADLGFTVRGCLEMFVHAQL